jgi:hypothetical protein
LENAAFVALCEKCEGNEQVKAALFAEAAPI